MAGNPTSEITISIYPSTAIFSAHYVDALAGSGIDITFTNSDCTVNSNYLVYDTETSCSGGNTLTITAYGHQYVISPINDNIIVNLPTQNLYAWTCSSPNLTFWTNTNNPTTTSHIFNSNGIDVTTTYIGQQGLNAKTWEFSSASTSSITFHCLGGAGDKGVEYNIPIGGTAEYTGIDYIYNRDTTKDIIIDTPEPIEYTYTFPTGKLLHIEVSGNGYNTLSTNVTLTTDRTVVADLPNGTITGGDVVTNKTLTFTVENPNRGGTITINGTDYSITNYIDGSYAVISQSFTVGSQVSFFITANRIITISDSTNTTYIPNTQSMYDDPANDRTYTFDMPNEDVSCTVTLHIDKV